MGAPRQRRTTKKCKLGEKTKRKMERKEGGGGGAGAGRGRKRKRGAMAGEGFTRVVAYVSTYADKNVLI